jgi:hypothetical protein
MTDVRRRLFVRQPAASEPRQETWWMAALRATLPSTAGLAVLSAISLGFQPLLAALLAGIIGGLAVAGVLTSLALRV